MAADFYGQSATHPTSNGASASVPAPATLPHADSAPERPVVIELHDHKAFGGVSRPDKKIKWILLAENGEYADYEIKVRVRYPNSINTDYFNAGSNGSIRDGLKLVVFEHNGWPDPDSESDPPAPLPPVDQKCTFAVMLADALKAEDATHAIALKEARTDVARTAADAAHDKAVQQIRVDIVEQKAARKQACCFWDSVSEDEIILMYRAVQTAKGQVLTFLLETKPT